MKIINVMKWLKIMKESQWRIIEEMKENKL